MRNEFQAAMYSVGVLHHYCGYSYFEDAVFLVVEEPERLQSIQKEIYLPIAIKYRTNVANVEKNIRTIRDVFMKNGGSEILVQLTGCQFWQDKKPYPKELIEIFADYFTQH
ncbi:MAG: hypothetical protein HFJ10_15245 [Lachnospiraceae bacterium]|jgi:hypothetical protein|nr:hypothetical protein [Lachnospiraceae bacterium]